MAELAMIEAQPRQGAGKGAARATRRAGLVPGVIYGAGEDPVSIALDPRDLARELNSGSLFITQYNVKVNGTESRVMARDLQFHPVTDAPMHVDFLRVTGKTRITVDIPVVFLNEETCIGLGRGGVLNVVRYTIEVNTTVDNIPETFTFDIAGLDIGDSVHISMTTLPEGVEPTISDRDFTVATIAAPTIEAEPEEEEEEEGLEGLEGLEGEEGEEGLEGEEGAGEAGERQSTEDRE